MLKFFEILAMIFMYILAFVAFQWFIGLFFGEVISFIGAIGCTLALTIGHLASIGP